MQDYRLLLPAVAVWIVAIIGSVDYMALGLFGLVLTLGGLLADRWYILVVGIALTASAISGMAHAMLKESDVLARLVATEQEVIVTGVVDSNPRQTAESYRANARIYAVQANDTTATSSQSVQLIWSDVELSRGSEFTGSGRLRALPEEYSALAVLDLTEVSVLEIDSPVAVIRDELRKAVENRPWHAQLIPGVVVGDDTGLPEHIVQDMRILGLSHLTAVSGAHVSLVIAVILGVLGRRRPGVAGIISAFALIGLVQLVGAEASVLRAGYMGLFVCVALAIRRATTAFPLLCLTIIIVALLDVELARSLGFQLSAVATGAIIVFSYPLQKRLAEQIPSAIADVLSISLIAAVATGPLLLNIQDRASIWSAVANALVSPVVAPLTILGMLGALLLPVAVWAAIPLLRMCEIFTLWMATVTAKLINLPGSNLPTHIALIGHAIIVVVLVAGVYVGMVHYVLTAFALMAGAAALAPTLPTQAHPANWETIQCDVGQGSAYLARKGTSHILIDVGPEDGRISTCLSDAGIERIDLLIISHFDADHVRGLAELIDAVEIGQVWYSENLHPHYNSSWARDLLDHHEIPHRTARKGDTYSSFEQGENSGEPMIEIVGPVVTTNNDQSTNADSLVAVVNTQTHRTLALADAPYERQLTLRSEVDEIDIVIVGHHGAADQSQELAEHLRPTITLVSVGENDYGHPTDNALRIWDAPIMARTDECGPITITATDVVSQCRADME